MWDQKLKLQKDLTGSTAKPNTSSPPSTKNQQRQIKYAPPDEM